VRADSTCWTVVSGAASGDAGARDLFAERYLPAVRAYFLARWRHPLLRERVEDAVQEAFVECFRPGGALERLDPARPGGFRPFLMAVLRNVARRAEERWTAARGRAAPDVSPSEIESDETSLSHAFDREWARSLLKQAGERHREHAAKAGEEALQRVELLRLRFREGLPIRDIATKWSRDAAELHHEYAKARKEFRAALEEVVAEHSVGSGEDVTAECERLLDLLG
jgi:RNA polymerase sigma-70 factor (ECF subfamily)